MNDINNVNIIFFRIAAKLHFINYNYPHFLLYLSQIELNCIITAYIIHTNIYPTFNILRYEFEGRFLSNYSLSLSLSLDLLFSQMDTGFETIECSLSRVHLKYISTLSRIYLPPEWYAFRVYFIYFQSFQSQTSPSPLFFPSEETKLFSIFPNTEEREGGYISFTDSRHGKLFILPFTVTRARNPLERSLNAITNSKRLNGARAHTAGRYKDRDEIRTWRYVASISPKTERKE